MARRRRTTWVPQLTKEEWAWAATKLPSHLLRLLVAETKVASLSMEAAMAMEGSVHTQELAARAALGQCLLSPDRAPCHLAFRQHHLNTHLPLQASVAHASVPLLQRLVRLAHSTHRLRLVCLQHRQATTLRPRRATHPHLHDTHQLLHRSLQRRQPTVPPRQRIWGPRLHSTVRRLLDLVQRRLSTVRLAHSLIQVARGARLHPQRRPRSARRARLTLPPALLVTRSTRQPRRDTRQLRRAQRRTHRNKDGRRRARRTLPRLLNRTRVTS